MTPEELLELVATAIHNGWHDPSRPGHGVLQPEDYTCAAAAVRVVVEAALQLVYDHENHDGSARHRPRDGRVTDCLGELEQDLRALAPENPR